MNIEIDRTGTLEGLDCIIQKLLESESKSIILLSCDRNGFLPSDVDKIIQHIPVPIAGGLFPAIIANTEKMEKGTIALGCTRKIKPVILRDFGDESIDIESLIRAEFSEDETVVTAFIFIDAFLPRINRFIDGIFNTFGLEISYIGCGAGSLDMMAQKPCLFTNEGLIDNAAVIATTSSVSGIGVTHGWQSVAGPYRVTSAERNIIHTLDWKPAFEVYRNAVEKISDKRFRDRNFYDISKSFPFGIAKLGAERVVRDTVRVGRNSTLICVGEVTPGSFVDILTGDENTLLKAVEQAYNESEKKFTQKIQDRFTFFIDCISRVLFLGDRFEKELTKVYRTDVPLVGACTIGEIANSGNQYLEFYNKTSVVAQIESL